jgi:transposase, IS6 family
MTAHRTASVFAGFRFPPAVISLAVRWYLRYGLSYRDVEELLAERGIAVDHVTTYRWVQRFTPEFTEAARPCRHAPGDRWFADESSVSADPRRRSRRRAESASRSLRTTSLPKSPATTGFARHSTTSRSPAEPTRASGSCSDAVQGRHNATVPGDQLSDSSVTGMPAGGAGALSARR